MAKLMRFGVSMDEELLERFDAWLELRGWANRSEAIRDLVRERLVEEAWQSGAEQVVATLTFIYDHHISDLQDRLTRLQHRQHSLVRCSMHVHLDHDNCLEVLVMHGAPADIQAMADRILGSRGVKHGQLVRSSEGQNL
jgi:CopG family nickel-responsive transcriptional regulator